MPFIGTICYICASFVRWSPPGLTTRRLVVIGYVWPEPNSSAAGENMLGLLTAFSGGGWDITFLSAAADSAHMANLTECGIATQRINVNCSKFDALIATLAPDVVIFDRFMTEEQFSWRVRQHCPGALRVLNTEDLHSLRHARQQISKGKTEPPKNPTMPFNDDMVQREVAAIIRSDLTLVISQSEYTLLTEQFAISPTQLLVQPLMIAPLAAVSTDESARNGFTFIGNFRHAPNWDALLYLKETLWPKIRAALPHASLFVYGAYPGKKVTNLHNAKNGFLIEGWAPDARIALSRHRVMLAPLRFGAGVKGKLVTAMQCQLPSITTAIGAEGIASDDAWPGAVTDNEDEFVSQSVFYYENAAARQQAVEKGNIIIARQFDTKTHQYALTATISNLLERLEAHRASLFYQQLLWHQNLRATQYMSQWIEAKNAKNNS